MLVDLLNTPVQPKPVFNVFYMTNKIFLVGFSIIRVTLTADYHSHNKLQLHKDTVTFRYLLTFILKWDSLKPCNHHCLKLKMISFICYVKQLIWSVIKCKVFILIINLTLYLKFVFNSTKCDYPNFTFMATNQKEFPCSWKKIWFGIELKWNKSGSPVFCASTS